MNAVEICVSCNIPIFNWNICWLWILAVYCHCIIKNTLYRNLSCWCIIVNFDFKDKIWNIWIWNKVCCSAECCNKLFKCDFDSCFKAYVTVHVSNCETIAYCILHFKSAALSSACVYRYFYLITRLS